MCGTLARMTTNEEGKVDEDHQRAEAQQGPTTAPGGPALRAALLALGIGLIWAMLGRGRRRGPKDLW